MKLEIKGITKKYKQKLALSDVNLILEPGVYGLLGPNGAGKSTMMNILAGVIKASKGQVLLDDKDIISLGNEYKKMLGYLPQVNGYYKNFTGKEFLYYMAAIKGLSDKEYIEGKIEELLEAVNLKGNENRKIGHYSGGMKQRLGIAQAFLNNPKILILDEPTVGLDPKERIRFRNLLTRMSKDTIILLATHIVSDVEYIADKLILIKDGDVVTSGDVRKCIENINGKVYEEYFEENDGDKLLGDMKVVNITKEEAGLKVRYISEKSAEGQSVSPTLEDLYMLYFG